MRIATGVHKPRTTLLNPTNKQMNKCPTQSASCKSEKEVWAFVGFGPCSKPERIRKFKIKINSREACAVINNIQWKAKTHTFSDSDIAGMESVAEKSLIELGLPLSLRQGAIVQIRSGAAVPKAHKYPRIVSFVTLTRGKSAWFLTEAWVQNSRDTKAGGASPSITPKQYEYVLAKFKTKFSIQVEEPSPQ